MNQIPVESYLSLVRYDGNGTELDHETIDSSFGPKDCTIYMYDSYEGIFDIGSAGTVLFWADSETGVVYMIGLISDSAELVFYTWPVHRCSDPNRISRQVRTAGRWCPTAGSR